MVLFYFQNQIHWFWVGVTSLFISETLSGLVNKFINWTSCRICHVLTLSSVPLAVSAIVSCSISRTRSTSWHAVKSLRLQWDELIMEAVVLLSHPRLPTGDCTLLAVCLDCVVLPPELTLMPLFRNNVTLNWRNSSSSLLPLSLSSVRIIRILFFFV